MQWFSQKFLKQWQSPPTFDEIFQLKGEVFREPEGVNRRTFRFIHQNKAYFIKLHWGVGWAEIFKNLVTLRLPILGAKNEWCAIQRFEQIGIETMTLCGYGQRGINPATQQSFVITESLEKSISLEDYCMDWQKNPPPPKIKYQLIKQVAKMTRLMHENGMNHRDLYICHFLLMPFKEECPDNLHLHLIDLHRVQQRKKIPVRWQIKDLGALWYSTMAIGLTSRDYLRFICEYHQQPLSDALKKTDWLKVKKRANALWKKMPLE